jgi:6-phosphofructokinase 2
MGTIGTFTLNPAVDKHCAVGRVVHDRKLRTHDVRYDPGGGGLNVARAAAEIGATARALFTAGGAMGDLLRELLADEGVERHAIPIEGLTRENLTVFEEDTDQQFRFTMPGPELRDEDLDRCHEAVVEVLDDLDVFVISGSVPEHCDPGIYARLLRAARDHDVRTVVDTSGSALEVALEARPSLIKPNLRELRSLTDGDLQDDRDIVDAARSVVRDHGLEAAVVSIGSGGAFLVTANDTERFHPPTVPIRSRIGAGDSMVAGLVVGLADGADLRDAVRYGVAAGAAAVITPGSELCRRDDVERLAAGMREQETARPGADS